MEIQKLKKQATPVPPSDLVMKAQRQKFDYREEFKRLPKAIKCRISSYGVQQFLDLNHRGPEGNQICETWPETKGDVDKASGLPEGILEYSVRWYFQRF